MVDVPVNPRGVADVYIDDTIVLTVDLEVRFMSHNHIPDYEPRISHLDPRQRNHPDNEMTRVNIGGDLSRRARLPAMSLFN